MSKSNLYNLASNNDDSYESSIIAPIILGALQIIGMLTYTVIASLIFSSTYSDTFSNGLSGLAQAIAVSNIFGMFIVCTAPVFVILVSSIILSNLNYKKAILQAILGFLLIFIGLITVAPVLDKITIFLSIPIFLIMSSGLYYCAYLIASSNLKPLRKFVTVFIILFLFFTIIKIIK